MLERLHEHIVNELGHSSRTDTIFVVAVLFNLITLGINAAAADTAAASRNYGSASLAAVVLVVFVLMTLFVNGIAIAGLYVGRRTRSKLLTGLVTLYADNQVDKYYDQSLISGYGTRYLLS